MKTILYLVLAIMLVPTFSADLLAQKRKKKKKSKTEAISEAGVKFKVVESNAEGMEAAFMKQMTMDMYFTEEKTAVFVAIPMMMNMKMIMQNDGKGGLTLMDVPMMGKKVYAELTEADMAKNEASADKAKDQVPNVVYNRTAKKTIAGYECYKATMKGEKGESDVVFWVTDALKLGGKAKGDMVEAFNKLEGFPLRFEVAAQGSSMVFEASEVIKNVDASIFKPSTEGYEKVSPEEMQQGMGM